MKRPAWQHYPADWRSNAKLRRCSWAARGVWMEVLGLMHDSDEYGILRWPLKEIANGVGCPLALAKELADKQVIKGDDLRLEIAYVYAASHAGKRGPEVVLIPGQNGPIWFSSRMVRDEHNRIVRGIGTRFGGEPNPKPNPPIGGGSGDGASTAVCSSTSLALPEPQANAREPAKAKNGQDIGRKNSNGKWRHDPDAANTEGAKFGVKSHPGESLDAFVKRIDQAMEMQRREARST